jgi:hypothetical protein
MWLSTGATDRSGTQTSTHSREILNDQIDYKLVSFQADSHHDLDTLLVYMLKVTFRRNVQPEYSNMTELQPGRRRSVWDNEADR